MQNKNNNPESKRPAEQTPELSFAQMEGKCYCCGKKGHRSLQCSDKDKPKLEWVINQRMNAVLAQAQAQTPTTQVTQAVQSTAVATEDDRVSTAPSVTTMGTTTSKVNWIGSQVDGITLSQAHENMKDWILLDSQSH